MEFCVVGQGMLQDTYRMETTAKFFFGTVCLKSMRSVSGFLSGGGWRQRIRQTQTLETNKCIRRQAYTTRTVLPVGDPSSHYWSHRVAIYPVQYCSHTLWTPIPEPLLTETLRVVSENITTFTKYMKSGYWSIEVRGPLQVLKSW